MGASFFENITLKSGGAEGSDKLWTDEAHLYGVGSINNYYVEGYPSPYGDTPLTWEESLKADDDLMEASKALGRKFPTNKPFVDSLLRRNWFQVNNGCDAVLAIGEFDDNNNIKGGTAWACVMALMKDIPIYFFDQNMNDWFFIKKHAKPLKTHTPTLMGIDAFAGIGTRNVTDEGEFALKQVFKKTDSFKYLKYL